MSTNNSTQQQDELDQIKSKIQDNLISSGNYDIINKQLKLQLYESGWYDKVSQIASRELMDHQQEVNSSNSNSSNSNKKNELTFDQLFAFVKPKAEELVPNEVKQDILNRITKYLDDIIQ
ncbi:protein SUS1 [Candida albicans P57072]|uniref:Transcription and mRNA export factor SUS1 n=4 Tax=Candida albicans TaxID=5476 RepID=SUS1_CANAL|nr:uncharacterized protein CAALFM_C307050WA [Candida albicans SC5314]Q5ADP6.1 RecName: Full=Transcription and mRNA export factor SUS1 [Candida albicans SC5314]EEQ44729.1 conserved hypothetical protein [Candida albicans WO-1]KAF6071167.1 Transcription factor e(y)2 family protein [Candida albicans]KGQ86972.1 protein SUS1 [Candida albicans P94015]KGQ91154.1 protein SUS1 [Candida albicans P37005]KGR08825.1 protein SUS1 [Candida albicans P57072]KGR10435.1 protein SUS1 [Candida albicans P78048]KG|eukprot:XP_719891.1 hypothetical protein CAALFM_C307050WA [Candida albicans SC5314]